MAYFKINNIDFSQYVNKLKIGTKHNYKGKTNAAGNLMVKYINSKKIIEVGIIPLDDTAAQSLQKQINKFQVEIEYLEPETKALKKIKCIVPDNSVDYYTIQAGKKMLNAYSLKFTEL